MKIISNRNLFYSFISSIKEIFPNVTKESIKLSRTLLSIDFCYCYGDISLRNYPDKYHEQINKINQLGHKIAEDKKVYEQFLYY